MDPKTSVENVPSLLVDVCAVEWLICIVVSNVSNLQRSSASICLYTETSLIRAAWDWTSICLINFFFQSTFFGRILNDTVESLLMDTPNKGHCIKYLSIMDKTESPNFNLPINIMQLESLNRGHSLYSGQTT